MAHRTRRLTLAATLLLAGQALAVENPLEAKFGKPPGAGAPANAAPPAPGPVVPDKAAHKALAHLAANQHARGGWGHKHAIDTDPVAVPPPRIAPGARGPIPRAGPGPARMVTTDPTLADTAVVTAAFLDAARTPGVGDGAIELTRATDYLAQTAAATDPLAHDASSYFVQKFFGKSVALGLALDALVAVRQSTPDRITRLRAETAANTLIARLRTNQRPNGGWVNEGQFNYVSDTLTFRALAHAHRAGLAVPPDTLARARARALWVYDPATGDYGTPSFHNYYQCCATLNTLHQISQNARHAAAEAAQRAALPTATPADKDAAEQAASEARSAADALADAQELFFKKLRDAYKKPANPLDAGKPAPNPLDAIPTDPAAPNAPAAAPDKADDALRIRVPISPHDAVAYFLLMEAMQTCTHPDARPVTDGVAKALASAQRPNGTWVDATTKRPDTQDHFLTAFTARALLVPAPPELLGPPAPPKKQPAPRTVP